MSWIVRAFRTEKEANIFVDDCTEKAILLKKDIQKLDRWSDEYFEYLSEHSLDPNIDFSYTDTKYTIEEVLFEDK